MLVMNKLNLTVHKQVKLFTQFNKVPEMWPHGTGMRTSSKERVEEL